MGYDFELNRTDINLESKFKTNFSVSGSCEFSFKTETEAKDFLKTFYPKKLCKEDLEKYIMDNDVPKGCCVCATDDGNIVIVKGNADSCEFSKFSDKLCFEQKGYYSSHSNVKELCNGNYVKVD